MSIKLISSSVHLTKTCWQGDRQIQNWLDKLKFEICPYNLQTNKLSRTPVKSLTLDFHSIELTQEQFYQLCVNNRDLHIERNANGDLIIMPPTGGETGNRNGRLIQQLFNWSDKDNTGIAFDSSTGFILPNGANRSPDASWMPISKWNSLSDREKQRFIPLSPDFVVELLSPSDNLAKTQRKMQEYIDNGTLLGWLINPAQKQVEIYRQSKPVEVLDLPNSLSGENILSGFILDLQPIF